MTMPNRPDDEPIKKAKRAMKPPNHPSGRGRRAALIGGTWWLYSAQKLATQQRLKEIATENLADALIARDAAWDQRDAALEEVRISKLQRPDGVLSYVAALRLQLDGTASMLAEVYDYVGTKALGEEMAPRVRAHLDALPKLSHSECTLLKKDLQ